MNVEKFKPRILDILRSSDLDTISSKSVRKILQQDTSEPLDGYKKELNNLIMECLDLINEPPPTVKREQEQYKDTPASIQSSAPSIERPKQKQPPPPKVARPNKKRTSKMVGSDVEAGASKKKKTTEVKKRKKRNMDAATLQKNPFTKSWLLSDTLSNLTGEKALSRPGVVKALWKYIKDNQLQDPTNKIYVKCDDKLRQVFDGEERVHGFTMNKLIGKHLSDLPADYVLDTTKKEEE